MSAQNINFTLPLPPLKFLSMKLAPSSMTDNNHNNQNKLLCLAIRSIVKGGNSTKINPFKFLQEVPSLQE